MIRERISDDIYVFTAQQYAQETAGAVITRDGVILIDTLFHPEETVAIKEFLEQRLSQTVRYVINTHYHADHVQGTYLFPEATVIGHSRCREFLNTIGRDGLIQTKSQLPGFENVEVVLPEITFERGSFDLNFGGKLLHIYHAPGHSLDMLSVLVMGERILFASDNMMPVPTLFDGDYDGLYQAIDEMTTMNLDSIVQGHGEVILRGEVDQSLRESLNYLQQIKAKVGQIVGHGNPAETLPKISIESCGKSRVPLNGLVSDLHQANLRRLYDDMIHGKL